MLPTILRRFHINTSLSDNLCIIHNKYTMILHICQAYLMNFITEDVIFNYYGILLFKKSELKPPILTIVKSIAKRRHESWHFSQNSCCLFYIKLFESFT